MPELSPVAVLQLLLLLSAVPAQYFISRWTGGSSVQRYHATSRLLRIWREWRASYLSLDSWGEWLNQQMSRFMSFIGLDDEDELESSFSIESMMFNNDKGYFGASKEVRSPRPLFVFLRVGEVVMERRGQRVGVVVSWDPEMRAPVTWVKRMYSNMDGPAAERTPHYKVLFSGPGPSSLLVAYLPQTQLERITGAKPDIPTLEQYFSHFNGERFVLQPWLRELFPEDEDEENALP
ncbi:uncharacterized protein ACB058_019677 [Synchiropus picturatus]